MTQPHRKGAHARPSYERTPLGRYLNREQLTVSEFGALAQLHPTNVSRLARRRQIADPHTAARIERVTGGEVSASSLTGSVQRMKAGDAQDVAGAFLHRAPQAG